MNAKKNSAQLYKLFHHSRMYWLAIKQPNIILCGNNFSYTSTSFEACKLYLYLYLSSTWVLGKWQGAMFPALSYMIYFMVIEMVHANSIQNWESFRIQKIDLEINPKWRDKILLFWHWHRLHRACTDACQKNFTSSSSEEIENKQTFEFNSVYLLLWWARPR